VAHTLHSAKEQRTKERLRQMKQQLSYIRLALLPLCSALFGCVAEVDSQLPDDEEIVGLLPISVRVATWNIETIGNPGTTEYNATVAVLKRINADIIGLNEVDGAVDLPSFTRLAQDAGYPFSAISSASPFGSDRNAFLSKHPIISQTSYTSALLSGDSSANDQTRLPFEIVVDIPGTQSDLHVFSQHWKSGFEDSDEFRRSIESFRIKKALASLSKQSDAYIVMGDLNFERGDSVSPATFSSIPSGMPSSFDLGSDISSLLSSGGFLNNPVSWLEDPNGPALSVVTQKQKDGSQATRPVSGRRIDYIFMSPFIIAQSPQAEIYDSRDESLSGGLPKFGAPLTSGTSATAADHLPVMVDIKLPASDLRAMLVSFKDTETIDGLTFNNEDIAKLSLADETFSLYFDGSDVGLGGFAIDGMAVLPTGEILLSFEIPGSVPGISGTVDDSDIVLFHPESIGQETVGSFSLYFDGSDVGLSSDDEDIDAISLNAQGNLVLSTIGNASISGLTFGDEDLFVFASTSLGPSTAGSYSLLFRGGDQGLTTTGEDIDAVAFDADGSFLLSTTGDASVSGFSGGDEDVFRFSPANNTFSSSTRFSALGVAIDADLGSVEMLQ
jgi:endonuclease/exonuclease/phosphatase family metal-dependent hydrolase